MTLVVGNKKRILNTWVVKHPMKTEKVFNKNKKN